MRNVSWEGDNGEQSDRKLLAQDQTLAGQQEIDMKQTDEPML